MTRKHPHLKPRQPDTLGPHGRENTLLPDFIQVISDRGCEIEGFSRCDNLGDGLLSHPTASTSFLCLDTSKRQDSGNGSNISTRTPGIIPRLNGVSEAPFNFDTLTAPESDAIATSATSNLATVVNPILLNYYCTSLELSTLEAPQIDASLCYSNLTMASGDYPQSDIFGLVRDAHHNPESNASTDLLLNRIPGIDTLIAAISNFLAPRRDQSTSRRSPPLPDPYSNSMLYFRTSTLLPYLYNVRCVGIEIQDLIALRSPFYRPNTRMEEDATSLLKAARKPWFPEHLQPTIAQVLFPHHPYIDLLPFPAFRERAIMLAALFDPMEWKRDIFREGLACYVETWGVRSLEGRQPWDCQSWEIRPWFSKKWRLLMDFPVTHRSQEIHGFNGTWPVMNMG